jgi:NAD(P)-dependent dehydrogenase (short-subunit alcohol dehydrogenase family)
MLVRLWVSHQRHERREFDKLIADREQFVRQALARGDKVVATGRNAATRLAHLVETGAAILDLDISIPQDEITAKINEAIQIYGRIDFVVNNAGYIESGAVEELSYVTHGDHTIPLLMSLRGG